MLETLVDTEATAGVGVVDETTAKVEDIAEQAREDFVNQMMQDRPEAAGELSWRTYANLQYTASEMTEEEWYECGHGQGD